MMCFESSHQCCNAPWPRGAFHDKPPTAGGGAGQKSKIFHLTRRLIGYKYYRQVGQSAPANTTNTWGHEWHPRIRDISEE